MTINYELLGRRIKTKRLEKGLTQEGLAELIQSSRSHIGRIETGIDGISLEMIVTIANGLGCSANDLLKDSLTSLEDKITKADTILSDCTPEENKLLTDNLEALRKVLRKYTIK